MEAHSLVQNGSIERYADPKMTMTITEDGNIAIKHHICADEEAIESLSGRLRPLIVESESIYLSKVLAAINSQVPIEACTEKEAAVLKATQSWFFHRYKNKSSRCYGIQLVNKDGTPYTDLLEDSLLAESWIYADTVHADPKGRKAEAQKLDYFERYRAASSFFCEFATIVVELLNVVRAIAGRGLLQIPDVLWNEPVTYKDAKQAYEEKVLENSVYVFPAGTKIPPDADPKDIPGATRVTPAQLQRLANPEGAASVVTFDEEMKQTGSYPAFCKSRERYFEFTIEGIGTLTIAKEALMQAEGPTESISFVPTGSSAAEVRGFLSSIEPPNWLGLQFTHEGEPQMIILQLRQDPRETDG